MICGIVDVGSNSVRLSIYKVEEPEGRIKLLLHNKNMASLASYVENGALSAKGIRKACDVLNEYRHILANFHIDNIYVVATASLRNIANTAEAVERIRRYTGFSVDVISGEEEARLDFAGAIRAMPGLREGLLADIGGASTELVVYKAGEAVHTFSMPIGSLLAYNRFVADLLPTPKERKAIRSAAARLMEHFAGLHGGQSNVMCGVGGAIRAANRLNNDLFERPGADDEISRRDLKKIMKRLEKPSKETINLISQTAPDRLRTIIPGMVILHTIAKMFSIEKIIVNPSGVREGYLYEKVLAQRV